MQEVKTETVQERATRPEIMGETVTLGGVTYHRPKMTIPAYMSYLKVRDSVMNTENGNGLYTAEQFEEMIQSICEIFGNQFTAEELIDPENGLGVEDIILLFTYVEMGVATAVTSSMEEVQRNFTSGA